MLPECFKRGKVRFEECCYELNEYNSECSLNEVDGKFVKVLELRLSKFLVAKSNTSICNNIFSHLLSIFRLV